MRHLFIFLLLMTLPNCVRSPSSHPMPREAEDPSIRFPEFYARAPVLVDRQGETYDLDGVTLRAIAIAANDFMPPGSQSQRCRDKQEAHRYRVVQQGEIVFVHIYENPVACQHEPIAMDSSVSYAIGNDGRILRRLYAGEPEDMVPSASAAPDAGTRNPAYRVDPSIPVGSTLDLDAPTAPLPRESPDGGVGPTPQTPPSAPPTGDGGYSTTH